MKAVKALGALAITALLLAGMPVLLARTIGNPLTSIPDLAAGDLNDRAVLAVLGAVAYLAWAQFAVAFLAELAAQLHRPAGRGRTPNRGRPAHHAPSRTPLTFAFQRHLARNLITAILLLSTGTAAATATLPGWASTGTAATATPFVSAAQKQESTQPEPAAAQHFSGGPEATVAVTIGGDGPQTWWDLAAAHLGAGDRWPELWALNAGTTQPDGTVMRTPGILTTGWTITIPAPAPTATPDPGREVVVEPGDTLSQIAADNGQPDWNTVWQANKDRTEPDGQTFTDPDDIWPGWTITIPAPATTAAPTPGQDVVVEPGDTLSQIAADNGQPDWNTVWQANKDRTEPDGQTFTDPDGIRPGWTITIPTAATQHHPAEANGHPAAADPAKPPATGQTATHPAPAPTHSPGPGSHTPTMAPVTATPASPPATPSHAPGSPTSAMAPDTTTAPPAPVTTTAPPPSPVMSAPPTMAPAESSTPAAAEPTATPLASGGPADQPDGSGSADAADSVPLIAGGAAVLLAGAGYLALNRYRRRQERHRRPGHPALAAPTDLQPVEGSLRRVGADATSGVATLDAALRGLAKHAQADPAFRLPDILAVHLRPDGTDLHLASPRTDPPAGWVTDDEATTWSLPAGQTAHYDPAADRPYTPAPYPLLATVGHGPDGDPWLLDLEHLATVQLAGTPEHVRDLARFIASELTLNTWSDTIEVTIAGLDDHLTALDPDRIRSADNPDTAVAEFVADWHTTGFDPDLLARRVNLDGPETETPHTLISTIAPDDVPVPDGRRHGRALIIADDAGGDPRDVGCALTIDEQCRIHLPVLGVTVTAEQLPPPTARQLADLLAGASVIDDTPADPAAQWEMLAEPDSTSQPGPDPTLGRPENGNGVSMSGGADRIAARLRPEPPQRALPLPVEIYEATTATTADDVAALAPLVSPDTRRRVEESLSDLDRDLADWYDPACTRPRISVLGPVTVRARGSLPSDKPRLAWNTEIVAYLATKGRPVTPEEYGSALWPDDPDITRKPKLRQSIHIVRRWLGTSDRTGTPHLPAHPGDRAATYGLHDALLDADLFRQLRLRGVARGENGLPDLEQALDLVTGRPYDRRRPGGYGWLAEDALDHQYTAMIVDLAHTVATTHLANGQPEKAAHAAQVALRTDSGADTPLLDLMHAHKQLGNHAEADACLRRIMTNHDADVEEDLPPRTFEILHRNGWLDHDTPTHPSHDEAAAGSVPR